MPYRCIWIWFTKDPKYGICRDYFCLFLLYISVVYLNFFSFFLFFLFFFNNLILLWVEFGEKQTFFFYSSTFHPVDVEGVDIAVRSTLRMANSIWRQRFGSLFFYGSLLWEANEILLLQTQMIKRVLRTSILQRVFSRRDFKAFSQIKWDVAPATPHIVGQS